jgi:hypothetical protein
VAEVVATAVAEVEVPGAEVPSVEVAGAAAPPDVLLHPPSRALTSASPTVIPVRVTLPVSR